MKTFFNVEDLGNLDKAIAEALEVKANRFGYQELGKNKTLLMIFFNNRLTAIFHKLVYNALGIVELAVLQSCKRAYGNDVAIARHYWNCLQQVFALVAIHDNSTLCLQLPCSCIYVQHYNVHTEVHGCLLCAQACAQAIVEEYHEQSLVFAMETATVHPLQAFADIITIKEKCTELNIKRPKVVLTWAPHCRALPQAVPNSFAQWMNAADVDFVVTHPEGYELDPKFVGNAKVEYDQKKALEGADFVYAKNWSCPGVTNPADYGKILSKDMGWTIDSEHMAWTNNGYFMHCLPVRRGLIVTDDVIESDHSLVIPEAANREISAEVVLKRVLESL